MKKGVSSRHGNAIQTIERMYYPGYVTDYDIPNYGTNGRKKRTGERADSGKTAEESAGRGNSDSVNEQFSVAGADDILDENLRRRLQESADKYGVIPPGENPTRDVTVPKKTSETKRASMTIRTVLEAGVTPDMMVPAITEEVLNETFSYERKSNEELQAQAQGWIEQFQDVDKAVAEFTGHVQSREYIDEDFTVRGFLLYNELSKAAQEYTAIRAPAC